VAVVVAVEPLLVAQQEPVALAVVAMLAPLAETTLVLLVLLTPAVAEVVETTNLPLRKRAEMAALALSSLKCLTM
jgi:hypothetical protein